MAESSLKLRLIFSSLIWTVGSIAITGVLIVYLFKGHIEKRFDNQLQDHLEELVAAVEVTGNGVLELTWSPADPRFNRPHSGWYWEIINEDTIFMQSNSLLTARLVPFENKTGNLQFIQINGPAKKQLRLHKRDIKLPRVSQPITFAVAGPLEDVHQDIYIFTGNVIFVLSVLTVFLLGIIILQVKYGLKPLSRLAQNLSLIRSGKIEKLPQDFPKEIRPLTAELNTLLEYNQTLLERARTQVGNLAHSLKNPIAVLKNETATLPGEKGKLIRQQLSNAMDNINRYLNKARIAGSSSLLASQAELDVIATDIKFSLEKLHAEPKRNIRLLGLEGIIVRADYQDIEELLGNLLDNACKWAQSEIVVFAHAQADFVTLHIEDDGPGISPEEMKIIVSRGVRLDETKPGTGLGLSIVNEICTLYGGGMEFYSSPLGGLGVKVSLPNFG